MNRFKMDFANLGGMSNPNMRVFGSVNSQSQLNSVKKNLPLNASMIDRVHKAKPGCSACGKKVV